MFECHHIRTVANVQEYEYRQWRFRVKQEGILWKMDDFASENNSDRLIYACADSRKLPQALKRIMHRINSEIQERLIQDALDNNHMDLREAHLKGLHA